MIKAKCAPYLQRGKPARRNPLINDDDYTIVATYGAEYRGIVQYYLLAGDVYRLNRLRWVMETSMLKTLAGKHRSTVSKMARKHKATIETPHGPRTCFEASVERDGRKPLVARFGGIPLNGRRPRSSPTASRSGSTYPHKELITRLLDGRCELCEQHGRRAGPPRPQTRRPRHAGPRQPEWTQLMANRRRKTLVVCDACHDHIHTGSRPHRSRSSHWRAGWSAGLV